MTKQCADDYCVMMRREDPMLSQSSVAGLLLVPEASWYNYGNYVTVRQCRLVPQID